MSVLVIAANNRRAATMDGLSGLVRLSGHVLRKTSSMERKYTHEELVERLDKLGWRTVTGNKSMPLEGTLRAMTEAAHGRRAKGHAAGLLQEIMTEVEVDLVQ